MAVKEGYKQTEVGVIPEDWEVGTLNNSIVTINPDNLKSDTPLDYLFYYITLENINQGNLVELIQLRFENSPSRARRRVKKCDVLVGTVRPNLMSHYYVNIDKADLICSTGFSVVRSNEQYFCGKYFFYHLFDSIINRQIDNMLVGSSYPAINSNDVRNLIFPIPPLSEQKAIATALSDIDGLIDSISKIIEKKKNIKQGAMQELLTGKKRLEGFSGEWVEVMLKDIAWFQEGPGVRTNQFTNTGMKLLNGTNIQNGKLDLSNTDRYISLEEAYGAYSHFLADEGDVVIASSGVSIEKFHEKVTEVQKKHIPFCMNTSTIRFKVKNYADKYFLINFLKSSAFKSQIGGEATGSAQLNFGPAHLNKVVVRIPPTEFEQTFIGSLLYDMDREIELFTMKLDKYRAIKQGMMQELLTGRIRLLEGV